MGFEVFPTPMVVTAPRGDSVGGIFIFFYALQVSTCDVLRVDTSLSLPRWTRGGGYRILEIRAHRLPVRLRGSQMFGARDDKLSRNKSYTALRISGVKTHPHAHAGMGPTGQVVGDSACPPAPGGFLPPSSGPKEAPKSNSIFLRAEMNRCTLP